MYYQTFKPSLPLQKYIQSYFIWEHTSCSANKIVEITSAPNGHTGMIFHYGNPYAVWESPRKMGKDYTELYSRAIYKKI